MKELKMDDILTFRNHKGEEKKLTRQEFRNAALGQQDIDHRPVQNPLEGKITPENRKFYLVE